MGTSFYTNRTPRPMAVCTFSGSGGITVFERVPYAANGHASDYYPQEYILSTCRVTAEFNVPGATGAGNRMSATFLVQVPPLAYIGALGSYAPIPVDLLIYLNGYDETNPSLYAPTQTVRLFTTLGTRPFEFSGTITMWADMVETQAYDETNDAASTQIGSPVGNRYVVQGVVNGTPFLKERNFTSFSSNTGISATLTAEAEARGSVRIAPSPTYTFLGTMGCHATIDLKLSDASGSSFIQETLKGQNYVTATGGVVADCRSGASVTLPARGAPIVAGRNERYYAKAKISGNPSTSFRAIGKIFAMDKPYPDPLTVILQGVSAPRSYTTVNGVVDTGIIRLRKFGETLNAIAGAVGSIGTVGGQTVDEQGSVTSIRMSIDKASMLKYGEHPDDSILRFHGHKWNGFLMQQVKEVVVDAGKSISIGGGDYPGVWQSLGGTSVSAVTLDSEEAGTVPEGDPPAPTEAIRIACPEKYTAPTPAPGSTDPQRRELGTRRTFTPAVWMSGYRYQEIRIRSRGKARQPVTVRYGKKLWFCVTGAADEWNTITIDTCDEMAQTSGKPLPLSDNRDSIRWASSYPGSVAPAESPFFGINQAASVDFLDMATGVTYEIAGIKMVRQNAPTASFLAVLTPQHPTVNNAAYEAVWGKEWYAWAGNAGTPTFFQRGVTADTDGRLSLEEPVGAYYLAGVDRFFKYITIKGVSDFIGKSDTGTFLNPPGALIGLPIKRNPGWTAVSLCDSANTNMSPTDPAGFLFSKQRADTLSSDKSAKWLWGGGAMWNDGKTCVPGVDIPVPDAGLIVPCQWVFQFPSWWPGAGDIWGYGASSGDPTSAANGVTVNLRFSKVLRGQAKNLIVGEGAIPDADGAAVNTVRLKDATPPIHVFGGGSPDIIPPDLGKSGGQGTGAPDGRYETRLPYPKLTWNGRINGSTPAGFSALIRRYDAILNGAAFGATGDAAKKDKAKTTPKVEAVLFESRHQRRLTFRAPGRAGVSVYSDPTVGFYARATARRWGISYQRAVVAVPDAPGTSNLGKTQWISAVMVAAPKRIGTEVYVSPALARFASSQMRLRWERQVRPPDGSPPGTAWARSVLESVSNDDGATWDKEILIMANARQPVWFRGIGSDTGSLISVYVLPGTGGDADSGTLIGQEWDAGAKSGDTFTFQALQEDGTTYAPLLVTLGAGYDGIQSHELGGRWVMTVTVAGEDSPSDWASSDEGRHWVRLAASP